jgi:hypothetical protein
VPILFTASDVGRKTRPCSPFAGAIVKAELSREPADFFRARAPLRTKRDLRHKL